MTASPAPGMPSAEAIEAEIRPMAYEAADLTECVERILDLIRPAFEAKEREIHKLIREVVRLSQAAGEAEGRLKASETAGVVEGWRDRALSAEAKLAQAVEALENATAFDLGDDIVVESRGKGTWAVKNFDSVLNADGVWEWEPQPSSRGDEFIARTRFSRDEAFDRARSASAAAKGEA